MALTAAGARAEPGELHQAIRLEDSASVRDLPGYADGWFTVQDAAAMSAAAALGPKPGSRVLDLCAAPGGKATYLAERMDNQGEVVACDVDVDRLRTLEGQCRRLGIAIVRTCVLEAENTEPPPGPFDAVIVDVPCSNTGVLGRRPEVRWRLRPGDFRRLVHLQTRLLLQATERVRPGGVIVYSTCSIEPEENQLVTRAVARALPWLTLEAEEEQNPGRPADGGYWARLRKSHE
jgi:16S rRNA (cytosine967-C5)-methyltransferase